MAEAASAPRSRRDALRAGRSPAREEKTKRQLRAESKATERDERAEAKRAAQEQRADAKDARREQRAHAKDAEREQRADAAEGARQPHTRQPHTVTRHGERGRSDAGRASSHHGHTRSVRAAGKTHTMRRSATRRSPLTRLIGKATIMLAAAGLVATTAVPAYAQFDGPLTSATASGKLQTLSVGAVQGGTIDSTEYGAHTLSSALDSTLGTVVAPETQALARQLMTAVAQGRLTGSNPDHIFEIRYLAAGEAVPGCGVDYRVLQAIAFALTQFNTVGISDINRHCTGQIEGAGTASAHYTDGGGHAVDFFLLNGHSLTGGDPDSVKLIEALDAVVPANSTVGQMNCRASLPLAHFQEIDDTCDHLHVDFLDATGATLLG